MRLRARAKSLSAKCSMSFWVTVVVVMVGPLQWAWLWQGPSLACNRLRGPAYSGSCRKSCGFLRPLHRDHVVLRVDDSLDQRGEFREGEALFLEVFVPIVDAADAANDVSQAPFEDET
jgi:hypothetical protein